MYKDNLKRQHKEIRASLEAILCLIGQNNISDKALELAREISSLSGKLKVHLIFEDNFLYPDLDKRNNKLKEIGQAYKKEMQDIGHKFMEYKDNYNTRGKIVAKTEAFVKDTIKIFELLKERLDKEDRELYPYL